MRMDQILNTILNTYERQYESNVSNFSFAETTITVVMKFVSIQGYIFYRAEIFPQNLIHYQPTSYLCL